MWVLKEIVCNGFTNRVKKHIMESTRNKYSSHHEKNELYIIFQCWKIEIKFCFGMVGVAH